MTKEWKKYQATILSLYKGQGKTLSEVMKIMERQYGFKASTRAYRSRFDRWDIRKYNKAGRKLSTMTMPACMPHSSGPVGTLQGVEHSRSPSLPVPMMIRSYSGPLPSTSSAYTPDMSYSALKTEHGSKSHSPGSTASSQNAVELHQRLVQHQQYYAVQPIHHNSHHVSIDAFADLSDHFPVLNHQHPKPTPDHHFVADSQLRHVGNEPDECDSFLHAFHTILENPMPPLQDPQRVQLFLAYIQRLAHQPQLNVRRSGGPNALELYVENYLSRDSIRDFCNIVASFVAGGADTTRIIPHNFSHTVVLASEAHRLSDVDEAVRQHQRQRARAVPTCAAVWASACFESLKGNVATADAILSVLPFTVAESCDIDVQALSGLLPVRDDPGMPPICPRLNKAHTVIMDHTDV